MVTKSKPYEQFGPYILFKRLESDALGELFRAARIDGGRVGPFLALRRLSGGDRTALSTAAEVAGQVVGSLTGPTFVRDQQIGIVAGVPTVAHEYAVGRSLRHIVDRARGTGAPASPIPTDQALVIAERVATSLATTAELRFAGNRLLHGGVIPQFVWISDDGEIRVAGQSLGAGLVASLRDEKVAADIGRYFAPEMHHGAAASKTTEVYALGAILYLVLTGLEPPDPTRTSAFTHAIRAAKTMDGAPMPAEVRVILEKSLNIDPAGRYDSPADMRAALSALTASGRYSATSFNLAFYLSTLLKKELESETAERERESATNVAAYMLTAEAAAVPAAPSAVEEPETKSRMPLAIAATLLIAVAGAGAWFFLAPKKNGDAPHPATVAAMVPPAVAKPAAQAPPVALEPIVASAQTEAAAPAAPETATADAAAEEAARKKAFDDAVKQRLQQELLKLQAEYTRQLQQQQRRNAPVLTTAAPQTVAAPAPERTSTVAQLDPPQPEAAAVQEQAASLPPVSTATVANRDVAPPVTTPATATFAPPVAQPVVPAVREGDVVDMNELDVAPTPLREPRPVYPPIAVRQRIEATIMASILISEKGDVLDVKILRGDPRFGFNDAATRAFRSARYTPPMKDGKRVRTWVAQMIQFKP